MFLNNLIKSAKHGKDSSSSSTKPLDIDDTKLIGEYENKVYRLRDAYKDLLKALQDHLAPYGQQRGLFGSSNHLPGSSKNGSMNFNLNEKLATLLNPYAGEENSANNNNNNATEEEQQQLKVITREENEKLKRYSLFWVAETLLAVSDSLGTTNVTGDSYLQVAITVKDLTRLWKQMDDKIQACLVNPLKEFISNEIKDIETLKKELTSAREEYQAQQAVLQKKSRSLNYTLATDQILDRERDKLKDLEFRYRHQLNILEVKCESLFEGGGRDKRKISSGGAPTKDNLVKMIKAMQEFYGEGEGVLLESLVELEAIRRDYKRSNILRNGINCLNVYALFDYEAKDKDELTFKKGDILYITNQDIGMDGWWEGIQPKTGKTGLIPSNFVEFERIDAPFDSDDLDGGERANETTTAWLSFKKGQEIVILNRNWFFEDQERNDTFNYNNDGNGNNDGDELIYAFCDGKVGFVRSSLLFPERVQRRFDNVKVPTSNRPAPDQPSTNTTTSTTISTTSNTGKAMDNLVLDCCKSLLRYSTSAATSKAPVAAGVVQNPLLNDPECVKLLEQLTVNTRNYQSALDKNSTGSRSSNTGTRLGAEKHLLISSFKAVKDFILDRIEAVVASSDDESPNNNHPSCVREALISLCNVASALQNLIAGNTNNSFSSSSTGAVKIPGPPGKLVVKCISALMDSLTFIPQQPLKAKFSADDLEKLLPSPPK